MGQTPFASLPRGHAGGEAGKLPRWEHFSHDADIGIRGWGPTPADAFAQAALAMTAVITDPKVVRPSEAVAIECEARELDLLLYKWLNALVFEMATRSLLFGAFEVLIDGTRLEALARGERIDRARHAPAVEVKGATLTELKVEEQQPGCWLAQCVVDV
jgi:SHS2 domain-containing protein